MFNYCCRISAPNDEAFEEARRLGVYAAEAACPLERYTPEELEELRSWLIDRGVKIALLDTALTAGAEDFRRLFLAAHLLHVGAIRLPQGIDRETRVYIARMSRALGIPTMAENQAQTALNTAAAVAEAIAEDDNAGWIFNPAEFVLEKVHPFLNAFTQSHIKNRIAFLRMQDRLFDGEKVRPGQGCAELKEMVSILLARSFAGYFLLEDDGVSDMAGQLAYLKKILREM